MVGITTKMLFTITPNIQLIISIKTFIHFFQPKNVKKNICFII